MKDEIKELVNSEKKKQQRQPLNKLEAKTRSYN